MEAPQEDRMSAQLSSDRRTDLGAWIRHGIIGGVIGGIVFAMFEMIMAAATASRRSTSTSSACN